MDIFAHGLWTGAVYKLANSLRKKKEKTPKFAVRWAVFWGIAPDLFAFSHSFILMWFGQLFLGLDHSFRGGSLEPASGLLNGAFEFSRYLYNYSHSIVIFIVVFGLIWIFKRRPYYELLGWALHIFIDLPTHRYDFFPTPIFWPISEWRFKYGISWDESWFMKLNYLALAVVYSYIIGRYLYKKIRKNGVETASKN